MAFLAGREISIRRACRLAGVSRRWLGYESRRPVDAVLPRLKELAERHPRYGYRRLWLMLWREGLKVNRKRVRRLCVLYGLKLSRQVRRKRRGIGIGMPCKAERPNEVWAYDFVHDMCENGRKLRILTVVDEFTRLCLGVEVEHRMPASAVCRVLLKLFAEHGTPSFVRSDNGPEFIAKALMKMLKGQGVECRHIEPGSPWQNGLCERFNGSLRDECLNLETFAHRDQARAVCRLYMRQFNQDRPHSALDNRTPAEFAAGYAATMDDPGAPPQTPGFTALGPPVRSGRQSGPGTGRERCPGRADRLVIRAALGSLPSVALSSAWTM